MLKNLSQYLKTEAGRLLQYILGAAVLIAIALMWQMFLPIRSVPACAPDKAVFMFDISWFCAFRAEETLVKLAVLLIVLRAVVNPIVAVLMGFANERAMLRDQQLQDDMNDSNARVNAWAALAMGWVILMTPYTYWTNYLANVLLRLPLTFLWAVFFSGLLVRHQLGIKTVLGYVTTFRLPKNEAVAIWTGAALVLAGWLVVNVH